MTPRTTFERARRNREFHVVRMKNAPLDLGQVEPPATGIAIPRTECLWFLSHGRAGVKRTDDAATACKDAFSIRCRIAPKCCRSCTDRHLQPLRSYNLGVPEGTKRVLSDPFLGSSFLCGPQKQENVDCWLTQPLKSVTNGSNRLSAGLAGASQAIRRCRGRPSAPGRRRSGAAMLAVRGRGTRPGPPPLARPPVSLLDLLRRSGSCRNRARALTRSDNKIS